jgi:hypothetical protein
MISSFSDAVYLIRGRPHRLSCFFEKTQLERLLGNHLFQITGFAAQIFHFVGVCRTCGIARQTPFRR